MTVLFVVLTIIVFLGIDWYLQRRARLKAAPAPASVARSPLEAMRVPEGIFFAPSHTWLSLFPSGRAGIGVDDFVLRLLHHPRVAFLKAAGDTVTRGEPLFRLEENGHQLTLRSPINGTVIQENQALSRDTTPFRDQLFSDGWAYILQPKDSNELKDLLLGKETRNWLRTELGRLRDVLAGAHMPGSAAPAFLQDGGAPLSGVLKDLDEPVWERVDQEFLLVR